MRPEVETPEEKCWKRSLVRLMSWECQARMRHRRQRSGMRLLRVLVNENGNEGARIKGPHRLGVRRGRIKPCPGHLAADAGADRRLIRQYRAGGVLSGATGPLHQLSGTREGRHNRFKDSQALVATAGRWPLEGAAMRFL